MSVVSVVKTGAESHNDTTTAYGYVRVSTAEQKKEHTDELQRQIIRDYCKKNGLKLAKIFSDVISGAKSKRPGLDALFSELEKNIAEKGDTITRMVVVVSKLDRFGRSLIDLYNNVERLKQLGVDFVSVGDPGIDTTTPNGRLLFTILGAIAEYERELIRMRLVAGRERAKRLGTRSGKPLHRPPKPMDERRLRELYLEEGWGLRKLAKEFKTSTSTIKYRLKTLGIYKNPALKLKEAK